MQEAWDDLFAKATRHPDGELGRALQHLFETHGTLERARRSLLSFLAHRGDWWPYTHGRRQPVAYAGQVAASLLQTTDTRSGWPDAEARDALRRYAGLLHEHGNKTDISRAETIRACLDDDGSVDFNRLLGAFFVKAALSTPRKHRLTRTAVERLGEARAHELAELHVTLQQALREAQALRRLERRVAARRQRPA